MKALDLLVSSVQITEDEYSYKGLFILSGEDKSLNLDIVDLESEEKLAEIKKSFELQEENNEIKKVIMNKVYEKASLTSKLSEGENYEETSKQKSVEKGANSLDMA